MNTVTSRSQLMKLSALGVVVGAMALAGCSPRDKNVATSPSPSNTAVVAQTDQTTSGMKADASSAMDKSKSAARDMPQDAKQAGQNAGDKISDKVSDAVITSSINAELAKDSQLSALRINVDTEAGRVALKGTAPSETAREHATTLATGVKGVVNVDNQLTVAPAK